MMQIKETIAKTLFIMITAVIPITVNAQSPKTVVGIESGFNFYTLHSDVGSYDSNFSFSPGFLINTRMRPKLSLQYGIKYVRKGAEGDFNTSGFFTGDIEFNLHYLEFPLNLNIDIGPRFYGKIGMYYGRLVDATFNYDGVFINGFGQLDEDEFQKNDFGFTIGAAFKIRRFHFGIQFQRSVVDLSDGTNVQNTIGESYNQGFSITVSRFFK